MKSSVSEYRYGKKRKERPPETDGRTRRAAIILLLALPALVCAALLVLSLFVRVELTQTCDENVKLARELEKLSEDNRRLRIEYEFAQDLGEIEKDAKSRLGMNSVLERRAVRIDTDTEDRAVIINDG